MRWKADIRSLIACATTATLLLGGCAHLTETAHDPKTSHQMAFLPDPSDTPPGQLEDPLGTPDSSPKTQRPEEPAELVATGVRVGSHKRFDRVVVDLEGEGSPGWYITYVSVPKQETSGTPLKVNGSAYLNINVDGTVPFFEAGREAATVNLADSSANILDVVNAGTFGGRTQVVVGLRAAKPYSVQVLENPKRLVVDILKS
ncbi:AMIN-like domain-containing (lipo)protein [Corynebacterium mayonis]|uniref:AMIN-like domain-containing (lipo)protein n=1 Tax=Corynebacterium mayonis TaxID=3062461 RepID=UPI00314031A5